MDLENLLVKDGWVNPNQFLKAKEESKKTGRSLYASLIKLSYINEKDVFSFFSQHAQIPLVETEDYQVGPELVNLFSENLYRQFLFLPLYVLDNTLYVAMANPLNAELLSTLRMHTKYDIVPLFSLSSSLRRAIDAFFGPDDKFFDVEGLITPPQTLNEIPFYRESERCSLHNMFVEVKSDDERVKLVSSDFVAGTAADISSSGKAMGINSGVYFPPKTRILLRFPLRDPDYIAKGEVMRCVLGREKKQYLLGIRFLEIEPDFLQKLIDESEPPQSYLT